MAPLVPWAAGGHLMSVRQADRPTVSWLSPYRVAVGIAAIMLLFGGFAYRAAADRFARPAGSVALPPGTLDRLPLEIAGWDGRDVPMDDAIIKATDADQVLNRAYRRRNAARQEISLFVAYGVRLRDLMPHRPEVCYPTNGWTLVNSTENEADLDEGVDLRYRVLQFQRGALSGRQITVLNYYIVDGEYSPDVELLRSRAWRPSAGARYVAQVQITGSGRSAEQAVRAFAEASAPAIHALVDQPGDPIADGRP